MNLQMSAPSRKVAWIKPQEPSFIQAFKAKVGYKEPDTIGKLLLMGFIALGKVKLLALSFSISSIHFRGQKGKGGSSSSSRRRR